jgi:hypothetical protein
MSDCACIGGYEGDSPDVYNSKVVTARKPHQCYECNGIIQPRDAYERVSGKWDGEWATYEFCAACSEIGNKLSCDGRVFGLLWSDIRDYMFPRMGGDCFDKLETAHAKEFLRAKWIAWKGLPS